MWNEGDLGYGGYITSVFHAVTDGDYLAYCAQPQCATPPDGDYGEDYNFGGDHNAMCVFMYYGWGGPGFDEGVSLDLWPTWSWDGTPFDSGPEYYMVTHLLVSDSYQQDGSLTTYGTDWNFTSWARNNVLGYYGGAGATQSKMLANAWRVPSDWYGKCYMMYGGYYQDLIGRRGYTPNNSLDVNWRLENASGGYTDSNVDTDYGRCSVKVGGAVQAANVGDFYGAFKRGSSYQVYDIKSVKTGYVYRGTVGDAVSGTLDADKDVRLKFGPIKYKVAYNANDGSGTVATSSHTYDLVAALNKNAFVRSNTVTYDSAGGSSTPAKQTSAWTWLGWNTVAGGSGVSYSNQQSVKNLTAADNATVTLYAQWRANNVKLGNPGTRSGYVFAGWYNGNTRVGGAGDNYTVTSNVTLTAKWNAVVTYVVDRNANGAIVTVTDVVPWNNTAFTIPAARTAAATRANCTHADGSSGFDGWYTDAAYTKKWVNGTAVTAPITLYSRNWATIRYAHGAASEVGRTYDFDGDISTTDDSGTIESIVPLPGTIEIEYGNALNLPENLDGVRVYYTDGGVFPFTLKADSGWCTDSACAKKAAGMVTGNQVLYKPWTSSMKDGVVGVK